MRTFNLADLFEIVAAAVPERTAFVCGDTRLSFAELDTRATRLANGLRASGVRRGDNVGIQLYNSAQYLESFFACCKIGAAPVNVNYRYVADELKYLFTTLDLRALVFGAEFDAVVAEVAPQVPTLALCVRVGGDGDPPQRSVRYEDLLALGAPALDDPQRSDNDLMLLCTGGTTGQPKGVIWPHKALWMAALGGGGIYFGRGPVATPEELAPLVKSAPPLTYFAIAPMMHGAAMWSSLISLMAGHTVVVNDQPAFDAAHIWDTVQDKAVNILSVVGDAMALPLVQSLEAAPGRWNLSALKVFGNGGALLTEQLQQRIRTALPQVVVNNGMGSSESGVIGGGERPTGGEGFLRIAPRPDLAVIDEQHRIVSAPGGEGTLSRTGYTPLGYYGDAKKSAETFVTIDGRLWVLTGDRARVDPDGHYVVLGRGSLCISTGGEKVFPEEVEEAIRRYAAVRDVLVVGQADERWGQKVAAVIELEPGASFAADKFDRVCRAALAGYKRPRAVYLVEQIRRSPAGKADYRWAQQQVQGGRSVI
jgi:acyl-CoA synthetase (AMP-forming)/AMP-acid ligase II